MDLPFEAVDSLEAALESLELDLLFFPAAAAPLSMDRDLESERSLLAFDPLRGLSPLGTLLFSLFESGFSPEKVLKFEMISNLVSNRHTIQHPLDVLLGVDLLLDDARQHLEELVGLLRLLPGDDLARLDAQRLPDGEGDAEDGLLDVLHLRVAVLRVVRLHLARAVKALQRAGVLRTDRKAIGSLIFFLWPNIHAMSPLPY